MDCLPEIITCILIRLPVKSLLRFRCVSKRWCAEIDDPDFIKLHLTHSITTSSNHFPIGEDEYSLYSLDFDSHEKVKEIVIPFDEISLVDSCNGLLLLKAHDLTLFNPSTRKHFVLPKIEIETYPGLWTAGGSTSFGYDVINDDYKLFIIRVLFDTAQKFATCQATIYSLKCNMWRTVKDFTKGKRFSCKFDAPVNGALHAINTRGCKTIVALDVGKEDFNMITMPNFADNNVLRFKSHVFYGCLAVLCLYPDKGTDIWVMKEYGVKESWSMFLSVKPENPHLIVKPMVYSKSRTEVLLNYDGLQFVWYDLREKTIRDSEFGRSMFRGRFGVCVESLVSVVGLGKIDEKKKQNGEEK